MTEALGPLIRDSKKANAAGMKGPTLFSPRFLGKSVFVPLSVVLFLLLAMIIFFMNPFRISLKRENRGKLFGQINIISPRGETLVRKSLIFRWSESNNADHYLVELFDEALQPVWKSSDISRNQVELPLDVLNRLEKNRPYFWMVTVFLEKRGKLESSLAQFALKD